MEVGEAQSGSKPPPTVEEDFPRGTDLPQDLVDQVVRVFVARLGYESPVVAPPVVPGSRLSVTNELAPSQGMPVLPVDAQCSARYEHLASKS